MNKINSLVIAPFYDIFIKEFIEASSDNQKEIDVFIPHNVLLELTNFIPLDGYSEHVRRFSKKNLLNLDQVPDNMYI